VSIKVKTTEEVETTKFLGLQVDNNLNWKTHIQYIIPKLSSACFAMRTIGSLMKTETLKLVYFACVHSIMSYGIIFLGKLNRQHESILHPKKNH
jgi:hypothetical protein